MYTWHGLPIEVGRPGVSDLLSDWLEGAVTFADAKGINGSTATRPSAATDRTCPFRFGATVARRNRNALLEDPARPFDKASAGLETRH